MKYPDKSLEHDPWGCACGSGRYGPEIERSDNKTYRIACGLCGMSGPWESTEEKATFLWNLIQAALAGPYSQSELIDRRILRIARESGDKARVELCEERVAAWPTIYERSEEE